MSKEQCPNCREAIKKGMFGENKLVVDERVSFINRYSSRPTEAYCDSCIETAMDSSYATLKRNYNSINRELTKEADALPILTTHTPHNWDYDSVSIVTAQTVSGTGVISEFTSGFTDLFGAQSGAYNKKLVTAEESCFSQLRLKALSLGANAIIATDIDYAEVGSAKGMLLLCMAGTAVKLKNIEILGKDKSENIKEIFDLIEKLRELDDQFSEYENLP